MIKNINEIGNIGAIDETIMKKTFIKKIKKMLEEQKTEILTRISNSIKNAEIDSGSGEEVDAIQARILALANKQLAERDKLSILKIDNALKRIENNSFGVCVHCGDDIEDKRILSNPSSAFCISCLEGEEIKKKRGY